MRTRSRPHVEGKVRVAKGFETWQKSGHRNLKALLIERPLAGVDKGYQLEVKGTKFQISIASASRRINAISLVGLRRPPYPSPSPFAPFSFPNTREQQDARNRKGIFKLEDVIREAPGLWKHEPVGQNGVLVFRQADARTYPNRLAKRLRRLRSCGVWMGGRGCWCQGSVQDAMGVTVCIGLSWFFWSHVQWP